MLGRYLEEGIRDEENYPFAYIAIKGHLTEIFLPNNERGSLINRSCKL